jgi:hypothetical protein
MFSSHVIPAHQCVHRLGDAGMSNVIDFQRASAPCRHRSRRKRNRQRLAFVPDD